MKWFEVDKEGLGKLLARRGKQFILYELIQNAWDENTTKVDVRVLRDPGSREVTIQVVDDNPGGFQDLSHAFTLFAESAKKSDAEKRGRFNLGEKLVLALMSWASIKTTSGTVLFDQTGRSEFKRAKDRTQAGSVFTGKLRLTTEEVAEMLGATQLLIPPTHIQTLVNGELLQTREMVADLEETLPSEIADEEGFLKRTSRKTKVSIFETFPGEDAMLYEMGIPVVVTGDRWHINIHQKVPLNADRDNVTPAYLGQVRAAVAERMARDLTSEDANSTWVRDAIERHGDEMSPGLINDIVGKRFGEKRVAYDPSDPEANALAVSKGYQVVHGSQMSKAEWSAVKGAGAILPAGQVTPSPKPFNPDGQPLKMLHREKHTQGMIWFIRHAQWLAQELMGITITVKIANDFNWHFMGCFGGKELIINACRTSSGHDFFDGPLEPIHEFIIHEFAHHYCGNHLDEKYHDALSRLGAKLASVALDIPQMFKSRAPKAEVA